MLSHREDDGACLEQRLVGDDDGDHEVRLERRLAQSHRKDDDACLEQRLPKTPKK